MFTLCYAKFCSSIICYGAAANTQIRKYAADLNVNKLMMDSKKNSIVCAVRPFSAIKYHNYMAKIIRRDDWSCNLFNIILRPEINTF